MAIYRCSQCGHLEEIPQNSEGTCRRCRHPVQIYDTVSFVRKALERYIALYRELEAIKAEDNDTENLPAAHSNHSNDIDFSKTTVLATKQQHQPLQNWFSKRQIKPRFDYSAVDMSGYFDEAAEKIGKNYERFQDILGKIGHAYRYSRVGINIDVSKMAQKEGQFLNQLCRELYSRTLFAKYYYRKPDKVIHLDLQKAEAIKQFFSGGWLEWFALGQAVQLAAQGKTRFSCARNVKITFENGDLYELDVVLFLEGKPAPIIIECKSGEFRRDIEKYNRLNKRLNLPDGHLILLAANLQSEQTAAFRSMYGLTFANLNNLSTQIRRLI